MDPIKMLNANAKEIKKLLYESGIKLEYLPPYSPDFNPIEYSFSVIKKAMQRYRCTGSDESLIEFAEKVIEIAKISITHEVARNQFRHCNIRVDQS